MSSIGLISLVVQNYDDAISFYVDRLGFDLLEDVVISNDKRWVVVAPAGSTTTRLLLARASNDEQRARIGDQTGGRVFLFLYTENFAGDYERMQIAGVRFSEPPRQETYGTVAVFEDLYGDRWDLIEARAESKAP